LVGSTEGMKEHGAERVGGTRTANRRRKKIRLGKGRSCASAWVCSREKRKIQRGKKDEETS
jgi:hypothetical protein